ncbi:hypothetical protein [Streptomyces tibetensis]|uniref:hypothetical protein n=1 Tax=Streptomyces tibetensis TaxID=2382123 RepID=UPI0033DF56DD
MTNTKGRTAALLTPVGQEAQDEARALAAVKLLRERTGVDLAGGHHLVLEPGGGPGTR